MEGADLIGIQFSKNISGLPTMGNPKIGIAVAASFLRAKYRSLTLAARFSGAVAGGAVAGGAVPPGFPK